MIWHRYTYPFDNQPVIHSFEITQIDNYMLTLALQRATTAKYVTSFELVAFDGHASYLLEADSVEVRHNCCYLADDDIPDSQCYTIVEADRFLDEVLQCFYQMDDNVMRMMIRDAEMRAMEARL